MANFLSEPPETATSGEKAFFSRIQSIYPEESHIIGYFEPDIGGLHPDYVLLSPKFGIVIVEIKDYSETYLKEISKSGKWERLKDENIIFVDNPFDQIHQYYRVVKDRVNKCHFPKELEIPITRLVVFSQISKDKDVASNIWEVIPNQIHACFKEVFGRNLSFGEFLNDILPINFQLEKKDFDLLRANIIPTCRLPTPKQSDLIEYFSAEDQVKLLDQEQEHLARELGEGHRLVFGVAGSGKTVLLIARARIIAKRHPNWKILILCYNKLLKNMLFNLLNPQDYEADITISTFHGWARRYILNADNEFSKIYQEASRKADREDKLDVFFQLVVPKLLKELLESQGDNKIYYDAILIDEAQDFEEEWFRLIMQLLNPLTNSLLIACDGLQGIYARKRFRWINVGIQARGRVKRFEKSYRVPLKIGNVAQKVLPDSLVKLIDQFDEFISTKDFVGEQGAVELIISKNRQEEYLKLTEKIARFLKTPCEILILFKRNMTKRNYDLSLFKYLEDNKIQWRDLEDYNFKTPGLLIGTLYGTKGLEAETIIIPELDSYKTNKDRQLLYVGITRSRKRLILSATGYTDLIRTLE
ncbi:MAG: UvrD-helicase domain-containing protein [Candidatus Hermodarchaeota archaeon]